MTATASANPDAAEPQIIDDRYRVLNILGVGNSGTTYLAEPKQGGPQVALKALSLRGSQDWKILELFEREVEILKTLDHPSIPRYIESFVVETETDRHFYLAQTLAEGKNLADWVEDGWRCTEAEVETIAKQLLDILSYLQSLEPAVIHRDLKPQNIIRSEDGSIALVDFGAVGHTYHNTFMRGSTVVGTFGYMAPEQFRAQAYPATDLYSLGGTLVFLLTRRSPAELPMNQLKLDFRSKLNLSPAFADWLERLLEPELEQRFATAKQAQKALKYRSIRRMMPQPAKSSFKNWMMAILLLGALTAGAIARYPYKFLVLIEDGRPIEGELLSGEIPLQRFLHRGGSTSVRSSYAPTLFAAALIQQDDAIAQKMLDDGLDLSQSSITGQTPLHLIARSGNIEVLRSLLDISPDVNLSQLNEHQQTALSIAPTEAMALELLQAGALQKSAHQESTFLDNAISKDWNTALLRYLEDFENIPPHIAQVSGGRLLRKAIQIQNWIVVNACIKAGCQLDKSHVGSIDLESVLELETTDIISALSDLDSIDIDSQTILHLAAQNHNLELTQALLRHGADPAQLSSFRKEKVIEGVLDYITNWHRFETEPGREESLIQSQAIFWELIDAGEDINQRIDGVSALHRSVETANSELEQAFLQELIRRGADVNGPSTRGNRPLHLAKDLQNIKLLLAEGANPNHQNSDGKTPIFRREKLDNLAALIQAGADINHIDKRNYSPIDHLEDMLHREKERQAKGEPSYQDIPTIESAIFFLESQGAKGNTKRIYATSY